MVETHAEIRPDDRLVATARIEQICEGSLHDLAQLSDESADQLPSSESSGMRCRR